MNVGKKRESWDVKREMRDVSGEWRVARTLLDKFKVILFP